MKTNGVETRIPLSLLDSSETAAPSAADLDEASLRRREQYLKTMAEELATALGHLERAVLASREAGYSARIQDVFDETQALQSETAREFGRRVGQRLGRESLWSVKKGVEVD